MSTKSKQLNMAFLSLADNNWLGGSTYQNNLLKALSQYAPDVKIYLALSEGQQAPEEKLTNCVVVRRSSNDHNGWLDKVAARANMVARRFGGTDILLRQSLANVLSKEIDVIFPHHYSIGRRIASLAWIPDFQHIHLPQMYSANAIHQRNAVLQSVAKYASLVVVSSQSAHADFAQFAPNYSYKARIMPFVAAVPTWACEADPSEALDIYQLPKKFIYIPNQFWQHKNHMIVFEALRKLRHAGIYPFIVCTGNPLDHRNPLYLAELMRNISVWGVREQVAILGMVPRQHVYMLIRQSLCVLNPSLFEGWSTSVEESKSIGKRILLSDLAVHREQDPPGAVFFDPHNSSDLAEKLATIWGELLPGPDFDMEHKAKAGQAKRLEGYAQKFVAIAREAVQRQRK